MLWTNKLMRVMRFKIRLAERLGGEGVFHVLPLAWNVLSLLFRGAN